MSHKLLNSLLVAVTLAMLGGSAYAATAGFEDVALSNEKPYAGVGGGRYWNGALPPPLGSIDSSFVSGPATMFNSFTDFGGGFSSWAGFGYSNTTDTVTPGFGNQFSALAGGGADGSANYAVVFADAFAGPPRVEFAAPTLLSGVAVTNTTYAGLSMRDGDGFAKQFGGASGDDADWFLLTITGLDGGGGVLGAIEIYLADYRDANNANDYILDDWQTADLSALGAVSALEFALSSSDNGAFGMNTPAYFALDNLTTVPLPAALWLLGSSLLLLWGRRQL